MGMHRVANNEPSVFEYSNYRSYLRDRFLWQQKKRPGWSYGAWARKLGLKSPSTLTMILKGERNPSDELVESLSQSLSLKTPEREFFHNLVRLERTSRDVGMNVLVMERLSHALNEMRPGQTFTLLDHEQFALISHWYFYAIREMVRIPDFEETPEWIQSRLRYELGVREIKEALRILMKIGLLSRDPSGKLIQAQGILNTSSDIANEGMRRFHEETLHNASESVRKCESLKREITGATFGIRLGDLRKIKDDIRKFQEELLGRYDSDRPDVIYQLENVFFPLTKEMNKETNP